MVYTTAKQSLILVLTGPDIKQVGLRRSRLSQTGSVQCNELYFCLFLSSEFDDISFDFIEMF